MTINGGGELVESIVEVADVLTDEVLVEVAGVLTGEVLVGVAGVLTGEVPDIDAVVVGRVIYV